MFQSSLSQRGGRALRSWRIPEVGGDTLFASQYAAYDALSDTMKRLLDGLKGISSSAKADVSKTREDRIKSVGKDTAPREYRASHPVVRTHPVTGRRALYVNRLMTWRILDMDPQESRELLAFLFDHQERPEFVYAHKWTPGDAMLWDNRSCLHARSDFDPLEMKLWLGRLALLDVLRVLYTAGKPVRVVSMSEMRDVDLKSSHIVYVGYISGLGKLEDFVFASSNLAIGYTYDELRDTETGETYASEAGMPEINRNYRDYALISTFPGPGGNQFVIVTGTRDAGMMEAAHALSDPMFMKSIEQARPDATSVQPPSFEMLYEVTGYGRMNLDAKLVHSDKLNYREIWGGNLLRVNPSEPTGYVQWSPTFGDALRTEFFGEFQFAGTPGDRV